MQNGTLLAAIDLGSNSFRLEIGRFHSGHIERVEYIKETVRQGNGLDENKVLSEAAMQRGWDCLARFAERLHGFKKQQVRAVATQTLREAQNRDEFMRKAQSILGFAIEVVSGHEEARLIYQGVSRLLPHSDEKRLVVDIGGRSTEMILGQGYTAQAMESYRLGSVAWSGRYFARGAVSAAAFKTAEVAAKAVLDEALDTFPPTEWNVAYGSSGTVGAVAEMLGANGWATGLVTRSGLDWLTDRLIRAGNVDALKLDGLKDDRRPVIAGGVAVLRARRTSPMKASTALSCRHWRTSAANEGLRMARWTGCSAIGSPATPVCIIASRVHGKSLRLVLSNLSRSRARTWT